MRKLLLLAPMLALASCAPAQGQKPMKYVAPSAEIIAAIAEIGPTVRPVGVANYFGVTEILPNQITLESPTSLLLPKVQVTFTALQLGNTTLVTHSYKGNSLDVRPNSPIDRSVQEVYAKLSQRFQMTP